MNTVAVIRLLSILHNTRSTSSLMTSSVEWQVQKPYWLMLKAYFCEISKYLFLTTFSKSFDIYDRVDIGRFLSVMVLSPFWIKEPLWQFQSFGLMPLLINVWLMIIHKGSFRGGHMVFERRVEIPPCPEDDLLRKGFSVFANPHCRQGRSGRMLECYGWDVCPCHCLDGKDINDKIVQLEEDWSALLSFDIAHLYIWLIEWFILWSICCPNVYIFYILWIS